MGYNLSDVQMFDNNDLELKNKNSRNILSYHRESLNSAINQTLKSAKESLTMFLASPTAIDSSDFKSFDSQESKSYKRLYKSPES